MTFLSRRFTLNIKQCMHPSQVNHFGLPARESRDSREPWDQCQWETWGQLDVLMKIQGQAWGTTSPRSSSSDTATTWSSRRHVSDSSPCLYCWLAWLWSSSPAAVISGIRETFHPLKKWWVLLCAFGHWWTETGHLQNPTTLILFTSIKVLNCFNSIFTYSHIFRVFITCTTVVMLHLIKIQWLELLYLPWIYNIGHNSE